MATSRAGYNSFRLRQFTGIPLSRICEAACDVAYRVLRDNDDLREEIMGRYSIRTPKRQLELDLERGYEKVIDD